MAMIGMQLEGATMDTTSIGYSEDSVESDNL
jgi:hypothetical protein